MTNAVAAMDRIGYRRVFVLYDVFRIDIASLLASPRIIKSGAVRMDVQSSMTELLLTPQGTLCCAKIVSLTLLFMCTVPGTVSFAVGSG